MLLHFSKKWSRYSEKVCKNALEKYIFSDFFHSPSNGKDPIWEVVSKLNTLFQVKINRKNFRFFFRFRRFLRFFGRLFFKMYVLSLGLPLQKSPIPHCRFLWEIHKKSGKNRISDAEWLKLFSDSHSTPQKTFN